MFSLIVRNLIFTILQPGIVAGLIPFLILDVKGISVTPLRAHHFAGAILFLVGLVVMLSCIVNFAVKGQGTLSPADPTKKLVISGLYRYSRNPMYVGVLLILAGEAMFFQSIGLSIYSLFIFTSFHIFTMLVEEPRLRNDFGEEYLAYCKKVNRWI